MVSFDLCRQSHIVGTGIVVVVVVLFLPSLEVNLIAVVDVKCDSLFCSINIL